MDQVAKVFFDPLLTGKEQIRQRLDRLPVGSAHPFSPERILVCKTRDGIRDIDISSYPEEYFFNVVDLGEMGEVLLQRMAKFPAQLGVFDEYQIMQAPDSTFTLPIVSDSIALLSVSKKRPTFYDFCIADGDDNSCCWNAQDTFAGIHHSGDNVIGYDYLAHIKIGDALPTGKEFCVFISGYRATPITKFLGTHPAVLVADHDQKILYIIPVPLDSATIGDASICCPLVFKRERDSLVFSILPKATTQSSNMCNSSRTVSPAFKQAIARADFIGSGVATHGPTLTDSGDEVTADAIQNLNIADGWTAPKNAVVMADGTALPDCVGVKDFQMIKFGAGLTFENEAIDTATESQASTAMLPCIFGTELSGPMLLATGACPSGLPFRSGADLRKFYEQLEYVVVIVNDSMMDGARNLASSYRMNAVFVVQPKQDAAPDGPFDMDEYLNGVNINAVTAMAGPQSLILVQREGKFHFYRGIANRKHLNTALLDFGSDVTTVVESIGLAQLLEPRAKRIYDLDDDSNAILLPGSGQYVKHKELASLFAKATMTQIADMEEDISSAVPQLEALLDRKDLEELTRALADALVAKANEAAEGPKRAYVDFIATWDSSDKDSVYQKALLRGQMRAATKEVQRKLAPTIARLSSVMSARTTSKRTHDLKRLERQSKIQGNVAAVKEMTFEKLAEYLEEYAAEMGVMVLNLQSDHFKSLLSGLDADVVDASACVELDSRVLHLDGLDAGIIIEASQSSHVGPLRRDSGSSVPIMAMPYLNQGAGTGSMLAWVCWDEFVNLETPFTTRWMEKCNEPHIAALRIIMRSTLSQAVVSREYDLGPGSYETGQLMGALLMTSISKLAAMRQTVPVETEKADDTVTKLMRGLFGNLLTVAGSGTRPMSMVWQLFGQEPLFDIPSTEQEWQWYRNVVLLYPYTGWPLQQFRVNLGNLLDKIIVRLVTKGEEKSREGNNRVKEMAKFCRLKNIQLDHCRTIITVLMRMLTEDVDTAACAARLIKQLPGTLERQTESYRRLIGYLKHLSTGGSRRERDDAMAANVYTRRSAAFASLKLQLAEACKANDWGLIKEACAALLALHKSIAERWQIQPNALKWQGGMCKALLHMSPPTEETDAQQKTRIDKQLKQAAGDAEIRRVAWQVGDPGEFGPNIEPLDHLFVEEMLMGWCPVTEEGDIASEKEATALTVPEASKAAADGVEAYKSSLCTSFYKDMQEEMTAQHVCAMLNLTEETLGVFASALNPEFVWEELGGRFRGVILGLLANRSNRAESHPARKLFGLAG